jgi:hypothetical protein
MPASASLLVTCPAWPDWSPSLADKSMVVSIVYSALHDRILCYACQEMGVKMSTLFSSLRLG